MISFKRPTSSRPVVGLDIEPGAIHAAQVSVHDGLTIERAASAELEPGVVRDGEIVDVDALAAALKTLFEDNKLGKRVRVGVANQRAVVRVMMLPPIPDPAELATAVRFQAESELPMPLDQAVLEHVSLGVVETPAGPRQRVLLVAARRDMIDRLLAAVRQAGLRPEGVDLSAFGMIRALPADPESVVMHLSVSGMTNLAITRGGQCAFTRVVAHGLESMAGELAARGAITVPEARQAILAATVSPSPAVAPASAAAVPEPGLDADGPLGPDPEQEAAPAPAPEPDLAELVLVDGVRKIAGEIRNSIDFHMTGSDAGGAAHVDRILLTGRAVGIAGFPEALAAAVRVPVEIATVAGDDPSAPGGQSVAAGLAIEEAVA